MQLLIYVLKCNARLVNFFYVSVKVSLNSCCSKKILFIQHWQFEYFIVIEMNFYEANDYDDDGK